MFKEQAHLNLGLNTSSEPPQQFQNDAGSPWRRHGTRGVRRISTKRVDLKRAARWAELSPWCGGCPPATQPPSASWHGTLRGQQGEQPVGKGGVGGCIGGEDGPIGLLKATDRHDVARFRPSCGFNRQHEQSQVPCRCVVSRKKDVFQHGQPA